MAPWWNWTRTLPQRFKQTAASQKATPDSATGGTDGARKREWSNLAAAEFISDNLRNGR